MARSKEHIVMLPFMAQGHIIPFLALAKKIQQRYGFTITLATTPLNINNLKTSISKDSSLQTPDIHLESLPFDGASHGLPPNVENSEALPFDKIIKLFHAGSALEVPFRNLISEIIQKDGNPPLCIISDVFTGWSVDVARDFDTVHVSFTTGGAYGTAAYVSIWQNLPHRSSGKDEFVVPGFPDSCKFHISHLHRFLQAADGTDEWSMFFRPQISNSLRSFGWLCNAVEEVEPLGLGVLRKNTKLPVWCIGPLIPLKLLNDKKPDDQLSMHHLRGREPDLPNQKCLEWLDLQTECSVLYICFGSQNSISPTQMMALARGLEESRKPFLWLIRPPVGFDPKGEFKAEWLPEGFEERTSRTNQGLLVYKWAPQLEILSHKSTAAFLSHCGWNSIMESLSLGVPIIGWPIAAEQGYNSKMLMEDMGVGVELCRGLQRILEPGDVKKVIEMVLDKEGRGHEMRKKAAGVGKLIRDSVREEEGYKGSSVQAIDDFITAVMSKRKIEN